MWCLPVVCARCVEVRGCKSACAACAPSIPRPRSMRLYSCSATASLYSPVHVSYRLQ